ncbi:probable E3 ubiquitin-protein ligase makorin-1 isoform X1 [Harmonia axyridis]|uniref:probable E3 ubiquitin-protein ligase makorin-1 isoform X1 n=1 Tax=Harmonia axyridis TaxID=115357 RepID=UPI001E278323|nr:probable E3 ubiquitin-protein ligase makorin-1 isoform X1 [Harmonia axyridis]
MAESTRTPNFRGRCVSNAEDNHRDAVKYSSNREQSQAGNSRSRNTRTCRFFLRGNCTRSECHFSHDVPATSNRHSPIRNSNSARRTNTKSNTTSSGHNQPSTSSQSSSFALHEPSNASADEDNPGSMNSLSDDGSSPRFEEASCVAQETSFSISNKDWVNAPEFVPSQPKQPKSYAQAVNPMDDTPEFINLSQQSLCPYVSKEGFCRYPPGACSNLHGDMCDMCGKAVMHPFNEEQRKGHHQECVEQHEKDMELSFALARSKEKSCGVCFEVIMEKAVGEQRFGILPNCNHCFCLTCIRKWRQARQFENKIIRACPECRITSDFVCPSMYWVDTKEDKDKLIDDYKRALAKKDCKYFKKGSGKCPFGNKCFYLHAFPDGTKCDVGPPPRQRRRRNYDHSDFDVLQHVILWDFLDDRANPWQSLADDLEDLVSFFSDSDDSDWSEYDFFYDYP